MTNLVYFDSSASDVDYTKRIVEDNLVARGQHNNTVAELSAEAPGIKKWASDNLHKVNEKARDVFTRMFITNIDERLYFTRNAGWNIAAGLATARKNYLEAIKKRKGTPGYTNREIIAELKTRRTTWTYIPGTLRREGNQLYLALENVKFTQLDVPRIRIAYNLDTHKARITGVDALNARADVFEFTVAFGRVRTCSEWVGELESHILARIFQEPKNLFRLYP